MTLGSGAVVVSGKEDNLRGIFHPLQSEDTFLSMGNLSLSLSTQ